MLIDKLLTPGQVAQTLGVRCETLAVWRYKKRPELRYVKVGTKVMYRKEDVEAFIKSSTINPAGKA